MITRILTIAGKGLDRLEQKLVDWTRQLEAVAPRNADMHPVEFVVDHPGELPPGFQYASPADVLRPHDRHGLVRLGEDDLAPRWAANTDLKAIEEQAARCAPPKPPAPASEWRAAAPPETRTSRTHGRLVPIPGQPGLYQPLSAVAPPSAWWATASIDEQIEKRLELRALLGREGYPDGHTKAEHRALVDHWHRGPRRPLDNDLPPVDSWRRIKRIQIERERINENQRKLEELPTKLADDATGFEKERRRGNRLFLEHEIRRSQMILRDLRGRSAARIRALERERDDALAAFGAHDREVRQPLQERIEKLEAELATINAPFFGGALKHIEALHEDQRQSRVREWDLVEQLEVWRAAGRAVWKGAPIVTLYGLLKAAEPDEAMRMLDREAAEKQKANAAASEPLPGSKPAIEVGQRWVLATPPGTRFVEHPPRYDSVIHEITDTEVFFYLPENGDGHRAATSRKTFVDVHCRLRRPEEIS